MVKLGAGLNPKKKFCSPLVKFLPALLPMATLFWCWFVCPACVPIAAELPLWKGTLLINFSIPWLITPDWYPIATLFSFWFVCPAKFPNAIKGKKAQLKASDDIPKFIKEIALNTSTSDKYFLSTEDF